MTIEIPAAYEVTVPAPPSQPPAAQRPDAPVGPAGPQGPTGVQGPVGPVGPTGADGTDGPTGSAGPAGPPGQAGPPGSDGPVGPVGPGGLTWRGAWATGVSYVVEDTVSYASSSWTATAANVGEQPGTGASWHLLAAQGSPGDPGADGAPGPRGPSGSQGLTGPQGATGPAGSASTTPGPKGPGGPTGPQGPAGANSTKPGPTGPTGPASTVSGPQGPQGINGVAGPAGSQGPTGTVAGPTGSTGTDGGLRALVPGLAVAPLLNNNTGTTENASNAATRPYACPYIASGTQTISKMELRTAANAAAGVYVRVAFYTVGTSGGPDRVLQMLGSLLLPTTAGTCETVVSPTYVLAAGRYWLVWFSTAATPTFVGPTRWLSLMSAFNNGANITAAQAGCISTGYLNNPVTEFPDPFPPMSLPWEMNQVAPLPVLLYP